ncbi:hypothetical protein CLCAR_3923 [Clostridium carboxidivorans P7]|nr:hypothetical protein CLCAR_3923 [Clostridium carboxidivorans P7]
MKTIYYIKNIKVLVQLKHIQGVYKNLLIGTISAVVKSF